jgi:hypothetical protein
MLPGLVLNQCTQTGCGHPWGVINEVTYPEQYMLGSHRKGATVTGSHSLGSKHYLGAMYIRV